MRGLVPSTRRLFSGRRFPLETPSSIGVHISSLGWSPLLGRSGAPEYLGGKLDTLLDAVVDIAEVFGGFNARQLHVCGEKD